MATLMEQLEAAGLTERQTECLALAAYDGLTSEEIGDRLGISRQMVDKHIVGAHARLRAKGLHARQLEPERPKEIGVDPDVLERLAVMPDPRGFDE